MELVFLLSDSYKSGHLNTSLNHRNHSINVFMSETSTRTEEKMIKMHPDLSLQPYVACPHVSIPDKGMQMAFLGIS